MSTQANKDIAVGFFQKAFVERNPAEAVATYMGDPYVQHNPQAPDGRDGSVLAIGGLLESAPDMIFETKRVIAEGDIVALHNHMRMSPEDRGYATVDLFRIVDGKIMEHWDVIQPIPEDAANDNTMF
jgi:predicted SnoaL-like aldol condensation-catalyzing enzyme